MSFTDHAAVHRYVAGLPTRDQLGDAYDLRCELSDAQHALDRRGGPDLLTYDQQIAALACDLNLTRSQAHRRLGDLGLLS